MRSNLILIFICTAILATASFAQETTSPRAIDLSSHFANRLIAADVSKSGLTNALPVPVTPAVAEVERRAFEKLNELRAAKGLPELEWNDQIASVARYHSQSMAKGKYFSHQDKDGLLVNERADRMGLAEWTAIGENIAFAKGFKDPIQLAIETWMNSPAHRDNILATRWTGSAVGVAVSEDGAYYFTQVFIARKL
jgi:uncharacterized protein YkwD